MTRPLRSASWRARGARGSRSGATTCRRRRSTEAATWATPLTRCARALRLVVSFSLSCSLSCAILRCLHPALRCVARCSCRPRPSRHCGARASWAPVPLPRLAACSHAQLPLRCALTRRCDAVLQDHAEFDPASLREHEEFTKVRNILKIELGRHEMDTWYFSPFPPEYNDCSKLYFCEVRCFALLWPKESRRCRC